MTLIWQCNGSQAGDGMLRLIAIALFWAGFAVADPVPRFWENEWPETDFDKSSVEFIEILSGGVPKDGIPALDEASFGPVAQADIPSDEPVVSLEIAGQAARAYPIRYLTWHEIVNDQIGDVPVTVTFCPLCNSAIVFDGRLGDQVLDFGVSGKLRNSDMIMYDRQTETWWQQFTGEAIVGELTGAELTTLPARLEGFASFAARHPDGLVMAEPTGHRRAYGQNPYQGYDGSARPFLFNGEMPPHGIEPLARVVRVGDQAWPLTRLQAQPEITEAGVKIKWQRGQASALDGRAISGSRDVGNVRVQDAATGADVVHEVVFAFAFHAFHPEGTWHLGD